MMHWNGIKIVLSIVIVNYCSATIPECQIDQRGRDYRGLKNVTVSGKVCVPWRSMMNESAWVAFPDNSWDEIGNNCRNPDEKREGLWCYTNLSDKNEWEVCNVEKCHDYPECKFDEAAVGYRGSLQKTRTGKQCRNGEYCRNPDGKPFGPWCFIDESTWEYCDVPFCKKSTCYNGNGETYMGTTSMTESGFRCQRWDKQAPHSHSFTNSSYFPDATLSDASNYCRNPGGLRSRPWCNVLSKEMTWDYCELNRCENDCKTSDNGRDYMGNVAVSSSGATCLRWDSNQNPIYRDINRFPDSSLEEASNYCRNPAGMTEGPFCLVRKDANIAIEFCDIPKCADNNIVKEAKHVVIIGVDGLHYDCYKDASGGAPNLLKMERLGTSTNDQARTVLHTVSGPGWTNIISSMDSEASGIHDNSWKPPYRGHKENILPTSGKDFHLPTMFSQAKSSDVTIRTAFFYSWYFMRFHSSFGAPGTLDKEMWMGGEETSILDEWVFGNGTAYMKEMFGSTEKSLTFLYFDNTDVVGHRSGWCESEYLQAVDQIDIYIGKILDTIEQAGKEEETLVMLTSDHSGIFNGHGQMLDEVQMIPLLIKGPGVRKGARFTLPISNGDLAPTAMSALRVKYNRFWVGKDLWEAYKQN